jgi:hypothetical protein
MMTITGTRVYTIDIIDYVTGIGYVISMPWRGAIILSITI